MMTKQIPLSQMAADGAKNLRRHAADAEKTVRGAVKKLRAGNPLLVRKKFFMRDVYFRKNAPGRELFRMEIGFDTQIRVLLFGAVLVAAWLVKRMLSARRRAALKRAERLAKKRAA